MPLFVSSYQGLRTPDFYRGLNETHRRLQGASAKNSLRDFMKLVEWRSFNRIASMAGPLAMKYAVPYIKPLFIYSEAQRQTLAVQQGNVAKVPPAIAVAGASAGKGAKAGFAVAAKAALSGIGSFLAPSSGGGARRPSLLVGFSEELRKKGLANG